MIAITTNPSVRNQQWRQQIIATPKVKRLPASPYFKISASQPGIRPGKTGGVLSAVWSDASGRLLLLGFLEA